MLVYLPDTKLVYLTDTKEFSSSHNYKTDTQSPIYQVILRQPTMTAVENRIGNININIAIACFTFGLPQLVKGIYNKLRYGNWDCRFHWFESPEQTKLSFFECELSFFEISGDRLDHSSPLQLQE